MKKFVLLLIIIGLAACHSSNESSATPAKPAAEPPAREASSSSEGFTKKIKPSPSAATGTEKDDKTVAPPSSTTATQAGRRSSPSQTVNILLPVEIRDTALGVIVRLPEGWHQNGQTVSAYGRKGELLNTEALYMDRDGRYELNIKMHPAPHARQIWEFHLQQFGAKKGPFKLKAKKIRVNGKEILTGLSERRFDGKGHPLDPPAQVYTAVWYDAQQNKEYEIYLRANRPSDIDAVLFERLLRSLKTY